MKITATVHKWEHGWELHIVGDPVTQVSTLDRAVDQIRDYLETMNPDVDPTGWDITVEPEIGAIGDEVAEARQATEDASAATVSAAAKSRQTARRLPEAGDSVTDSADILGVSRGVSQLVGPQR